jgi:MFS family permease
MEPFIKAYGHYDTSTGGYVLSSSIQSLTTSIINAGEFVGAISSFLIDNKFGRRGGLFVSSAFVVIGTIFQVAADNLGLLITGRLLLGKPSSLGVDGILLILSYRLRGGTDFLSGTFVCRGLCASPIPRCPRVSLSIQYRTGIITRSDRG